MVPLPTDIQPTVAVALGCLAVPGALLLGAAAARAGLRSATARAARAALSAMAGILLLTLVAADLVPDAVEENAASGGPLLRVLLPAALAFLLTSVVLWRPAAGCCTRATGLLTAVALVCHGLLEGFVVGLGAGVGLAAGLGLIALLAGHRFAEGFVLGTSLRTTAPGTRRVLMVLAAVTPLVGGDIGVLASPGPRLAVVITGALAGLLGAAGLRLVAGAASSEPAATDATPEPARPTRVAASEGRL